MLDNGHHRFLITKLIILTPKKQWDGIPYMIMQIMHGVKLLWLQSLVEIRGKTFVVVSFMQYLLTSFMKLSLENFRGS